MKSLTASDRKSLIRLAASLPKGSSERRAVLAGLKSAMTGLKPVEPLEITLYVNVGDGGDYSRDKVQWQGKSIRFAEEVEEAKRAAWRLIDDNQYNFGRQGVATKFSAKSWKELKEEYKRMGENPSDWARDFRAVEKYKLPADASYHNSSMVVFDADGAEWEYYGDGEWEEQS